MRHYQLIPVRYNDQQLLVRCEPVDAELWSIQWHDYPCIFPNERQHWFADVSPLEHDTAQQIVNWLNTREAIQASLPPDLTVVESRSK